MYVHVCRVRERMLMRACLHVSVCLYVHVCIDCVRVCVHVFMRACLHASVCLSVHVRAYICVSMLACMVVLFRCMVVWLITDYRLLITVRLITAAKN